MSRTVQVLVVEGGGADALLVTSALSPTFDSADFRRVNTLEAFLEAANEEQWDAVMIDCDLPEFGAPAAMQLVQELKLGVPVILLSWGIGEACAVAAMRAGASDCVLKSDLGRLGGALGRELREAAERRAQRVSEENRRTRELRLATLLNSTNDVIFTLDREQRHTGVFGRRLDAEGLDPDRLLGRSAREVFGEDLARVHEEANARAMKGESVLYESSLPGPRGLRHFQTSLSALWDGNGRVSGLVGFRREITAQKTILGHLQEAAG